MHKNKVSLFGRLMNFGCIMDMGCYVDIVQNAFSTRRQWCYVSRGWGKHLLSCAEEQGDVIEFTVA